MANSLQDQLLKSGLVTEGQAKQQKQRTRKKKRRQRGSGAEQDGLSAEVRAARASQQARDRALNEEKERVRQRKELRARMRQLLRSARVNDKRAEDRYNFAIGSKLKSIYVTVGQRKLLAGGKLAVVMFGDSLYLVAPETVDKARAIDPGVQVHLSEPEARDAASGEGAAAADDPYAGYEVPDDLMW